MSKNTPQPRSYAPREGVFIPRRQVQKMRRARDLLDDARRHARETVDAAGAQAEQVQRQAFAEGYEDGMLAAAAHVLAYFGAAQQLTQRLHRELELRAGDLLGAALDRPDAVLALLNEWLEGHAGPVDQSVRIRLPNAARGLRLRFNAAVEQAGMPAACIAYHDDPRLIILCGEQVMEFDPPASVGQGRQRLLAQFEDLPADCRALSEAAVQRWREAVEQRCAATEPAGDQSLNQLG